MNTKLISILFIIPISVINCSSGIKLSDLRLKPQNAASEAPPDNTTLKDLTFYLYTKSNLNNPLVIQNSNISQLKNSVNFDSKQSNIILIHGWRNGYDSKFNTLVKNAIFSRNFNFNVFVADWSPIAKENYLKAARAVSRIGTFIGNFLNEIMLHFNVSESNFTLIGHSLGAHAAGNAGSITIRPIDHIIGLDPAGPLFNYLNSFKRLDAKHARYVQVIHTNGLALGYPSSIGHVDYYPNGGMIQNGCSLIGAKVCSHSRAYEFLAEAIEFGSHFISVKCRDYVDFRDGKCDNNEKSKMGLLIPDKRVVGDFYLETNSEQPFAKA